MRFHQLCPLSTSWAFLMSISSLISGSGFNTSLLDNCSISLTSYNLKVLPSAILLNAQGDLPKMKCYYVSLAWTEVWDAGTQPTEACPALGRGMHALSQCVLFMLLGHQLISMPHSPCTRFGDLAVEVVRDLVGWLLHFRKEAWGLTENFWGAALQKSILGYY